MAQDIKYLETDFFNSRFFGFLKPSVHDGTAKGPFFSRAVDGGGAVVASIPGERGAGVVQSTKKNKNPSQLASWLPNYSQK